mmetsp:Transcript_42064/g.46851  ORF Transcript_42064/g.46851 Transcript_42064/m.46851 type:complete len:92 (-) Transcript_42064:301-576(-)
MRSVLIVSSIVSVSTSTVPSIQFSVCLRLLLWVRIRAELELRLLLWATECADSDIDEDEDASVRLVFRLLLSCLVGLLFVSVVVTVVDDTR